MSLPPRRRWLGGTAGQRCDARGGRIAGAQECLQFGRDLDGAETQGGADTGGEARLVGLDCEVCEWAGYVKRDADRAPAPVLGIGANIEGDGLVRQIDVSVPENDR